MTPIKRTRIAASLLAAAVLCLPLAAKAQCIPSPFPANWLVQQEAPNVAAAPPPHGGHTIARHVGKTDQQLINRVAFGGVNADGTFPTMPAAQATITAALGANAAVINAWAANAAPGASRSGDFSAPVNIGRVAYRTGNAIAVNNTCAFRTVLRALGGGNCYLLTAFPKPPTPADHCP